MLHMVKEELVEANEQVEAATKAAEASMQEGADANAAMLKMQKQRAREKDIAMRALVELKKRKSEVPSFPF